MYSFNKAGAQEDKMKDNDRYIGAGLTFKQDALTLVGVYEGQIHNKNDKSDVYKNGHAFSLGGNYDFGVTKVFAGAQLARHADYGDVNQALNLKSALNNVVDHGIDYLKDCEKNFNKPGTGSKTAYENIINNLNAEITKENKDRADDLKLPTFQNIDQFDKALRKHVDKLDDLFNKAQVNGCAFTIGAQVPMDHSKVTAAAYYGHYKQAFDLFEEGGKVKSNTYGLAARYEHFVSNRTTLYTGAGIGRTKLKNDEVHTKTNVGQIYLGLRHNF